jgi:hypothetical protein
MITVDKSYVVTAPVDRVFSYISNPIHDKDWQASCQDAQPLTPGPIGKGSEYQLVFRFLGQNMTFGMRVTRFEPVQRFGYETTAGPMFFRGIYTLNPCPKGTAVAWTFEAEPSGLFGVIPLGLVTKFFSKQVGADIDRLKGILGRHREVA